MEKTEIKRGNPDLLDLTPIKAIRAYCLDCMCGSSNEVKDCVCDGTRSPLCPLYKYRLGHNPNIPKREISEEQRIANAERLRSYLKNANVSKAGTGDDKSDDRDGVVSPSDGTVGEMPSYNGER